MSAFESRSRRTTTQLGALVGGRYKVLEEIGVGGFGRVFRAEHIALHREVALKLLSGPSRGAHLAGERFRREAFAAGRVTHPNCVDVLDFAEGEDGQLYMAMELLEGRSLTDALAGGPMKADRALRIIRHVLAGLEHAHALGIVHRDIKPANVFLVEQDGDRDFAKILDFGIAKLVGEAAGEADDCDLTQDGFALGSPTYMSPEQATAAVIDGRSDLYSVTVLLFEMLTGRPPFFSDDKLAVLGMHMSTPAPLLGHVIAGLPPHLEQLVADGLAKSLDARVPTATAYIARIDALLDALAATTSETAAVEPLESTRATRPARPAGRAPQARAPQPRSRIGSRWGWVAGVAALALIAAMAIPSETPTAMAGAFHVEAAPVETEVLESVSVAPDPEIVAIDALIASGQRRAAKKTLLAMAAKAEEAPVLVRLGHVYMGDMWWAEGFRAYRRAFAVDDTLRRDPRVIGNAIRSLMSQRRPWLGERFLVAEIGEAARPQLEHASKHAESSSVRKRAARVLERI